MVTVMSLLYIQWATDTHEGYEDAASSDVYNKSDTAKCFY